MSTCWVSSDNWHPSSDQLASFKTCTSGRFPRDKLCTFEIFPKKHATFSKLSWQVVHIWGVSKQKNPTFLNFQTATAPGQSSCNIQTRVPMSTDSSNEFSQTTEASFCSFEYKPPATYLKVSQNIQILYLYECSLKCDRFYIYAWNFTHGKCRICVHFFR